ncbi:MAG TPA: type 1 glutamine amidotransferase domain-containing protein [Cyclobacteriaceae bacterium]|nr:type 1 glutamine amidotransferase domain-containing protein [Cyclobacteriaceae bacterium]
MNKLLTIPFTTFILIILTTSTSFSQKSVLIISTNIDSVGNNRSGTYLMEIAFPFKHFTDKGFTVDIVTPRGSNAAIYEAKTNEELARIRDSRSFIDKTSNTLSPDQVNPSKYSAVFVPGGHGQFFDVSTDERIARIIAKIYEAGGVIGTAGHGTASIINVALSDCSYLVAGKTMTTFPTYAELKWMNISNYGKLLPFDMAEVIKRRGAKLVISTPETIDKFSLTNVVDRDNRFVTGSFAKSAQWVAEEMVKLIK